MLLSRDLPVLRIRLRLESKKERVSQDFRGLKKIEWIEHYVSSLFLRAGNLLIRSSLICSFCSNQMCDCELFAQIAQDK